ncbi:endospore germination permease [Clostridium sp. Marseille-Q2269]|uniref:GerAB/ArcD/ProY family transporter n=1 Tax=Clostridium sp. Marseille-Q2269 TaxID=2942205 RepID=UPI00207488CE|nr:endospore germination permease [Clostridium sp. Marseille-Q2269]
MASKEDNILTESQLTLLLIGSIISVETLNLPNTLAKVAKQNAWIPPLLTTIYPLYILFITVYIRKKHPKEDILNLSKKIYGKFLGNILNIIFLLFFFILGTEIAGGISNVLRTYMVNFLSSWNILSLLFLVTGYIAYQGTKPIGRLSEVLFYLTFIVFIIPLLSMQKANILNLQPLFEVSIKNIVTGVKDIIESYAGVEMLLILYPFVNEEVKLKKVGITSIIFITLIYTLYTVSTVSYLGPDTASKFLWPIMTISKSTVIPIINSFSFIFLSLWTMSMFKCISINYYLVAHGLNEVFNKISRENFVILLYPIMIMVSNLYGNVTTRRILIDKIFLPYAIFNIIFISITAVLIALGKGDKNET